MSAFADRQSESPRTPSGIQPDEKQTPQKDVTNTDTNASINPQNDKPYIFDELKEVCTLGTGSFGTVKLVHHERSGDVMALKILKKHTIVEFRQEKNILSEKKLLLECTSCPFVINLISTFNFPNKLCMLLELVQGGELLTHLYDRTDTIPKSSYGGFTTECLQFYLVNILLAYEFMHSKDILYRDLKPENILVNNDGYIKLADFGFAKLIPYVSCTGEVVTKTYTIVGSPEYMAPEMISQVGYDQSVDYWCIGCLMFELLFANSLFAHPEGLALLTQNNVTKATTASITESFPEPFREQHPDLFQLTMSFLEPNPSDRVGYKDIRGSIRASAVFDSQFWSDIEERKAQPVYIPAIEHQLDSSNFFDYDGEEGEGGVHSTHHDLDFEGDQQIFELF